MTDTTSMFDLVDAGELIQTLKSISSSLAIIAAIKSSDSTDSESQESSMKKEYRCLISKLDIGTRKDISEFMCKLNEHDKSIFADIILSIASCAESKCF